MDRFIALANIARFEQMLERETDPEERRIIETLLSEERARLRAAERGPVAKQPHLPTKETTSLVC